MPNPRVPMPPPETITYNGRTYTYAQWAQVTGITVSALRQRIKVLGWPLEQALKKGRRWKPGSHMMTVDLPEGPVTKPMSVWARERGVLMSTISRRLGLGWTDPQALGFEPGPMELKIRQAAARKTSRKTQDARDAQNESA